MTTIWDMNAEKAKEVGIDYDLSGCIEYNDTGLDLVDFKKVMAVWVGEHDGDDWRWIIKLTSEAKKKYGYGFVFIQGGCDYTGWDCQSWATKSFAKTSLLAAKFALGNVPLENSSPVDAGLGHMLNILSGGYGDNFKNVYDSLMKQLKSSKSKTWREGKDEELNVGGLDKV